LDVVIADDVLGTQLAKFALQLGWDAIENPRMLLAELKELFFCIFTSDYYRLCVL